MKRLCHLAKTVFVPKRWEDYRDFFSVHVFRYLVTWFSVVPILAAVFSDLPREIALNISGQEISLQMSLPFSWICLWVSSLLFVIALIIYYLGCPIFVRKAGSGLVSCILPFCRALSSSRAAFRSARSAALVRIRTHADAFPNASLIVALS